MKALKNRLVAIAMCMVMLFSFCTVPVGVLAASGDSSGSFVSSLFSMAAKACVTKGVSWGLDGFMTAIFGAETPEEQKMLADIQEQLTTVLANQDKILDELNHLGSLVEVQTYMEVINHYTDVLNQCQSFLTCYDTLMRLDREYENDPDALKSERLRALTEGLNISVMTGTGTDADQNYLKLYSAFVGPHTYSVNGEIRSGDLFDVYREIKRYQYCWENEAWDEMEAFFEYSATCFALISSIEMASVQARIQICDEHNQGKSVSDPDYWSTASLQTWLYNEQGTAANSDLESRINSGEEVYKKHPITRQNVFRHYWKPGHELLFYRHINNLGDHPVDEPLVGKGGTSAGSMFKNSEGLYMAGSGKKATLRDEFWNQFYDSKTYPNESLVTTDEINTMLEGCNHSMTLEQIIEAGDFSYSKSNSDDLLGLILKKDDAQNPITVDETHNQTWQEYIGTLYTDKIKPYVRYIPMTRQTRVPGGGAEKYGTYYYYHTDDGSVKWNIQNNYTAGSLGQLFVCEGTCMHEHLRADESTLIEPTCTSTGKAADLVCPDCGKVFIGETLPKADHVSTKGWLYDQNQHYMICDVCGEKFEVHSHNFSGGGFITGIFSCDTCGYLFIMQGVQLVGTKAGGHKVQEDLSTNNVPTGIYGNNESTFMLIGCIAIAMVGAVLLIRRKSRK